MGSGLGSGLRPSAQCLRDVGKGRLLCIAYLRASKTEETALRTKKPTRKAVKKSTGKNRGTSAKSRPAASKKRKKVKRGSRAA